MRAKINKCGLLYVSFWMIFCFFPAMSWAVLVVQTEVVSGNIVRKYGDHSVKLDNGEIYRPSRKGLVVELPVGEPITLRYFVEEADKNVFFEFAPGLNSLKKPGPVFPKKDNSPK